MLNTPVLLIIFKRLDTTRQVLEKIREVKPKQLFIAADGARPNVDAEARKCEETRNIINEIDWECDVQTLFQDKNLGCGLGPVTAITWFFEHVEQGIILEDDCLPDASFFHFCEELLNRYKHDTRMMHIAGTNHHMGKKFGDASYYFSRINPCWGWATWRRAWKHFDYEMKLFPKFRDENKMYDVFHTPEVAEFKIKKFETGYQNIVKGVWDYQWQFAFLTQSGMAIMPNKNMVKNIGFDQDATHTFEVNSKYQENIHLEQLDFPLTHPEFTIIDHRADDNLYFEWYKAPPSSKMERLKAKIPAPLKKIMKTLLLKNKHSN
ncbi:hypothetical protein [Microscilla marina]|uniref:Methyltransferase FkbM n=1 Tax=Microscilla marina ATCC 23134 TaxID=313606 RepID=A1ZCK4_MICM2|nr:hypothetical protein [Microscilla marina]EAY32006.1 methyltransferase FkbM [Microscilla marina ATCC 23134]